MWGLPSGLAASPLTLLDHNFRLPPASHTFSLPSTLQQINFDEALKAAFHVWTAPSIREWMYCHCTAGGAGGRSGRLVNT